MEELRNLGSFTNSTVTLFNQLSGYQASPNVSKRHWVCIPLLQDWQSWDSRRTWLDTFRVCVANSTLSQRKKNSSKGTICYPGQVPRRDKQTTQCLPSDRRSSAFMVYSISGLHLTENIILKDQKPTDVPVRLVCLPAKVQVEQLIGLVKHHHPTELT